MSETKNSEYIRGVSLENLEKLARIIKENGLEEIKITDKSVIIKGKRCPPPPPAQHSPSEVPLINLPFIKDTTPVKEAYAEKNVQSDEEISGNAVRSPIVGTYYGAPAPGKPPFVREGQSVKKGDVIMIIESMKLMNEVQSEFDGIVKKILVKDGESVEYDQTIMIIG